MRFTWTALVFVIFEYSFVKEISQMRCVSEWHAEDLQYLIGASLQAHIMLHDSNETVGTDGRINLYSDSVLGSTPEFLDFEMLLEPLEEKLYLPTVLIEVCNLMGCQFRGIGQEHKLTALLLIIESIIQSFQRTLSDF